MNDASQAPAHVPNRTIYKLLVLLILVGGFAYANSFTKPFHLDDAVWISKNDKIGDLGEYVRSMPSRPGIALLTHLNYRLHGLSVFGYHLVNLAIHIAAALALFGVVRRTLLLPKWQQRYSDSAHWFAFAVAVLWMTHPLQTQAVTYIIQRCESFMGLFYLLTFYFFIRGLQSSHAGGWYLLSIGSCFLSASSKEVIVTILPVMICYEYVFVGSWKEMLQRRWWMYLGVGIASFMPALATIPELTGAAPESSAGFAIPHLRPNVYMMTQAGLLLHYIRLIFVPYPQSFSYRGWPLTTEFADFWPAGLAIAVLAVLTAGLLLRRHWVGFAGAWFFGILSVTSIVPLLDVGFEHRLYLPLAAFCALVVFPTHAFLVRFLSARAAELVGMVLLIFTTGILVSMTMLRNEDYRNTEVLWTTVHQLYPKEHESLNNIASGFVEQEKLDVAKNYYEKSLRIAPGMFLAEFGYGIVLCKQDDPEEGLKHLLRGVRAAEGDAHRAKWNSQSNWYIGAVYWILGDLKAAEEHERRAIQFAPTDGNPYGALALILHKKNRQEEAREYTRQAVQLTPKVAESAAKLAQYNLHGTRIESKWVLKEALFHASVAALMSDYKNATYTALLAEAYAANQMFSQAIQTTQEALKTLDDTAYPQLRAQLERSLTLYQGQLIKASEKKNKK